MNSSKFKNVFLFIGLPFFVACNSDTANLPQQHKEKVGVDTTSNKTLVVTKVKTPWYGFRFIVVPRFIKTLPEYAAIKGLNHKSYHFQEDRSTLGGLYLWKSKEDAQKWFNQEWFERVEKTYGVKGVVEYYEVINTETLKDIDKANADYYTVFSSSAQEIKINKNAIGLIKIVSILDSKGEKGFVTLWSSKSEAHNYYDKTQYKNSYFDTPVLLNNLKQ